MSEALKRNIAMVLASSASFYNSSQVHSQEPLQPSPQTLEMRFDQSRYQEIINSYSADNTEDSIKVAQRIDFLVNSQYEHPSNMCGPLSASVIRDLGFINNDFDVHSFWLATPDRIGSLLSEYTQAVIEESISQHNFFAPPKAGDIFYFHGYSGPNGFDHIVAVSRTDNDGRSYGITNYLENDQWKIGEVLLFSPNPEELTYIKTVESWGGFGWKTHHFIAPSYTTDS